MAVHGSIGEYSDSIEDWTAYTERLENYFTANDVEDGSKKRAILLSVCGAATYKLIRSLAAPEKPTDYSYEALKQMVKTHHNPKPSVIVQRFKFNTRVRQGGESIAKFVAELRQLSEFCDFGETLSDMLRDRLVCGIGDTRIQRRLLAEPELTFQKALTLSQAMELADRDTKDLQVASTVNPAQIHKLHKKASSSPKSSKDTAAVCYRCGGKHLANHCRFKEAECHACGKKGHIAKVCKSKKTGSSLGQRGNKSSKAALKVQDSVDVADTLEYTLFPVSDQQAKPVLTTVRVDGKELCMEVDTGASVSLVSEATVEKLWGKERLSQLQSSKVKLRTYTGQNISVIGSAMVKVQSGGQIEHLPLLVVGGNGPSLLGRDWLFKLRLDWTLFPAPTGPPQSFTVTQRRERNMTFSWSSPAPTLRNGVITGYSLSCVPETGGLNSISMQYTAAGTFTMRAFTPATSYNCSIFASNSQGSGPATYLINTTLEACK